HFTSDGSTSGGEFEVDPSPGYQYTPAVAFLGDDFVVTWLGSDEEGGYGILGRRFMPAPPGHTTTTRTTTTPTTTTPPPPTRTTRPSPPPPPTPPPRPRRGVAAPAPTPPPPAVHPPACDTMTGVAATLCVFDRDSQPAACEADVLTVKLSQRLESVHGM